MLRYSKSEALHKTSADTTSESFHCHDGMRWPPWRGSAVPEPRGSCMQVSSLDVCQGAGPGYGQPRSSAELAIWELILFLGAGAAMAQWQLAPSRNAKGLLLVAPPPHQPNLKSVGSLSGTCENEGLFFFVC